MKKINSVTPIAILFALFFTTLMPVAECSAEPVGSMVIQPKYIVVDNYDTPKNYDSNYYSSIDTDRGSMGDGIYSISIGSGTASVNVASGWGGVWTSLKHTDKEKDADDTLSPRKLLGTNLLSQFQPRITGIIIKVKDGSGLLKVELKNVNGAYVFQNIYNLSGGSKIIKLATSPTTNLKELNWLIDGPGHVTVNEIGFTIDSPQYSVPEAVFLFSYGHFSQAYDPVSGLVRDRARWPVKDFAAVPSIGMYALATAVAYDLGYAPKQTAQNIVNKAIKAVLKLPTHHGLLPHFLTNGIITKDTEWSSVDTVITLTSLILASDAFGINNNSLKQRMRNMDWNDLTDNGTHSIGQGYNYDGTKISYNWDTFGSESFIMAVAYSAATGNKNVLLDACQHHQPTWNGSGFNDELATLFFPMKGSDLWGNVWTDYRQQAFDKQFAFFSSHYYGSLGLFGLSAAEVPDPWKVSNPNDVYQAFGVGGCGTGPNTGKKLMGYPVIAPHYAAMIAAEHPAAFEQLFTKIISDNKIFTPLNNVESFGIDSHGKIHWSSLKGSWNVGMQTLGASRALSANYLAYRVLKSDSFLYAGFKRVFSPQ